jgi:hypothetical protein
MIKTLHEILIERENELKNEFLSSKFSTYKLITYSVTSTTFRSFRENKKYTPSSVFQFWAHNYLAKPDLKKELLKRIDFSKIRQEAYRDLTETWKKDGGSVKFYQYNKLIDLFFKHLTLWNEIDEETRNWIYENSYVPLDKWTLLELKKHTKEFDIPNNVSMNFITKVNYPKIQNEIKKLCKEIPVMTFDLYAWDKKSHNYKFELKTLSEKEDLEDE